MNRIRIVSSGIGVVFALVLFSDFSASADVAGAEGAASQRIVGGVQAAKSEFPSLVSLQMTGFGHFCGGTLIRKDYVLTAAHCVVGQTQSKLKAVIGLQTQGVMTGTESFSIKRIVVHPLYGQKTENDSDYALIQLNGASKFTPSLINSGRIDIPAVESQAPIVTAAGWGATREGGGVSRNLMKVDLPLVTDAKCAAAYPGEITDTMICAGISKGGKDSCQGDSGGPLFIKGKSGTRILAGVVSWGNGCARPGLPGVYSKVSAAVTWISGQISAATRLGNQTLVVRKGGLPGVSANSFVAE